MVSKLCAGHAGSSGAFAPTKEVPPPAALCKFTAVRDVQVPAVRFVEERGWQAERLRSQSRRAKRSASSLAIKSSCTFSRFVRIMSSRTFGSIGSIFFARPCHRSFHDHDAADIIMFVFTSRACLGCTIQPPHPHRRRRYFLRARNFCVVAVTYSDATTTTRVSTLHHVSLSSRAKSRSTRTKSVSQTPAARARVYFEPEHHASSAVSYRPQHTAGQLRLSYHGLH